MRPTLQNTRELKEGEEIEPGDHYFESNGRVYTFKEKVYSGNTSNYLGQYDPCPSNTRQIRRYVTNSCQFFMEEE